MINEHFFEDFMGNVCVLSRSSEAVNSHKMLFLLQSIDWPCNMFASLQLVFYREVRMVSQWKSDQISGLSTPTSKHTHPVHLVTSSSLVRP